MVVPALLLREELEAREADALAPYAMRSGRSAGRRIPEPEHLFRGAFQRDRERVIHARAFRRLQYKTQVFVNHEGDYFRTRLTHSLEAAQIARAAARALRLNEDLAEAIALAHDVGHPPFGHAGERALAELMADHGGFEHNAQALRTVDLLERRYTRFRGLNLTLEVREGLWKHRGSRVWAAYGYEGAFTPQGPLLEAQLSDFADGIAYDHHDLDDALKLELLRQDEVAEALACWREAAEVARGRLAVGEPGADLDTRAVRQETIRCLVGLQVRDLLETTHGRLRELGIETLEQVRGFAPAELSPAPAGAPAGDAPRRLLVDLSATGWARKRELEALLRQRVYRHYRVVRHVEKARRFLCALFREYVATPAQLPDEYQAWVRTAGLERAVCDYLAGMTDRYAQDEYRRLFYPFERL